MIVMQCSLFHDASEPGRAAIAAPARRALADGAWIDYQPGWLADDGALMARLVAGTAWRQERRCMYERMVDVPRLTALAPTRGVDAARIARMAAALGRLYEADLSAVSLVYYRDGSDSVAPHGDKIGAHLADTVIAIVSLGAPRRFTLRRVRGPGSFAMELGRGDLLVMGGSSQRTWLHGVPKVAYAEPRISLVFRPSSPAVRASDRAASTALPADT